MKPERLKSEIDAIALAITETESSADELGEMAAVATKDGNPGFAEATLTLCRLHRIKAIKMRAEVAGLWAAHGAARYHT
jgi:hypothetical protein